MDYASPGLNGKSTSTISRNGKHIKVEATALLAKGWWPVMIHPPGIERPGREVTKGKEPIGKDWGLVKITPAQINERGGRYPDVRLGVCLGPERGPNGEWLIDLEGDGDQANQSLVQLLNSDEIETASWLANRGGHNLFFADGPRLLDLLARCGAVEGKGHKRGVFKLADLPDLEIRCGGHKDDGVVKQVQSVIPPSPRDDGSPREWIHGLDAIKPLPEAVYGFLEAIARKHEAQAARGRHEGNGAPHGKPLAKVTGPPDIEARAIAYLATIEPAISGQKGHDKTFGAVCRVGPGFNLSQEDCFRIIRDHYSPRCSPPWSDAEIRHKVEDAYKEEARRGWLLDTPPKNGVNGHRKGLPTWYSPECPECPEVRGDEEWPPLRLKSLPPEGVFPLEVLPDECADLATRIAGAVGCAVSSIAAGMLTIGGGVIGRTVHLKLKENWIVHPGIFHANVADPGQGKTWGQKYLTDGYLKVIEEDLEALFSADKAVYLEQTKRDKKGVYPKPVPGQLLIDDSTIEAMFLALSHNPRGLLSTLDELSVLFSGLNQYKGGKGADRSHFLKVWAGIRVMINRCKNEFGEPLRIPYPHLSITGNIPPDNLHLIRGAHGNDGMQERWLYTFPDWRKKLKASERGCVPQTLVDGWDEILKKLWAQKMVMTDGKYHPLLLEFDHNGSGEFFTRSDKLVDEINDEAFPHHLRGPWSKLEIYAGRFANVLHPMHMAASGLPMNTKVGTAISDGAWKLVDYFKGEYKRVLAFLDSHDGTMPQGVRAHLNWIKNHPDTRTFKESDISSTYSPNKGYPESMMADARQWLAERNAIRRITSTVPDDVNMGKSGRKPSPQWQINPELGTSGHSGHSGHSTEDEGGEVCE